MWGVGRTQSHRLRRHQKYYSNPPVSGFYNLDICSLRGFEPSQQILFTESPTSCGFSVPADVEGIGQSLLDLVFYGIKKKLPRRLENLLEVHVTVF